MRWVRNLGDWVICVSSSAAREAAGSKSYPSDLTIVGIIDHWEPDPPKTSESLSIPQPQQTFRGRQGQLMEIMQVMGTLVCSYRVAGLDHMHLRILKNNKGKKLVAVDPVGAREGNWVFTASGSAARHACPDNTVLTDLTIGGIIDFWNPDG